VGGFIALAVVELLLLIYVFAKLLSFRAHKKRQNPASSSAVRFHTCGTIINFDVQGFPLAHSLALFLLLDPSISVLWFLLELGAFQFVELVIVLQQLPIRTTTELPSLILGSPMQLLQLGCCSAICFRIRVMKKSELLLLVPICKQRRSNE